MITEREIFLTNPDEKAAVIEFLMDLDLPLQAISIIRWDFLRTES